MAKLLASDIYKPKKVFIHSEPKSISFDIKMTLVSHGDFSKYMKENNKIDKMAIVEAIFNGDLEILYK